MKADAETFLPFSEAALALEFAEQSAMTMRYVPDWNRWMIFDGAVWARDELLKVPRTIRMLCQNASLMADKHGEKMRLLSARTVNSVLSLARSDKRLVAVVDQWDENDMLLNCDGLVYDLEVERYDRPALPGDYFTKSTRVKPAGECPMWMEFLALVTGGDAELIDYLQRMAGYCLTGSVEEQCLFFLYGPGGNGKSTFINTLSRIMGGYATPAAIETFTATRNEQHPTDLADLMGARLVTATETGNRRRWDETRIKLLTGGDRVKARFMRQDFFEYRPCFKLVISGNHKPALDHVDEAMRRRVQIVPFTVKIEESQRVKAYEEVLKDEWPGILRWMLEGALLWGAIGLDPPLAVRCATADYLENEDVIGAWLEECTTQVPEGFETRKEMFKSWQEFCKNSGEHAGQRKAFVQSLTGRSGLKPHMRNGQRGWLGVRLNI